MYRRTARRWFKWDSVTLTWYDIPRPKETALVPLKDLKRTKIYYLEDTLDSWTIVSPHPENGGFLSVGLCKNFGESFYQHTTATPGRHLGRRVKLSEIRSQKMFHAIFNLLEAPCLTKF